MTREDAIANIISSGIPSRVFVDLGEARRIKKTVGVNAARTAYLTYGHGSFAGNRALQIWDRLMVKQIQRAQSFHRIIILYTNTPPGSQSRKLALEKMIQLKMAEDEPAK